MFKYSYACSGTNNTAKSVNPKQKVMKDPVQPQFPLPIPPSNTEVTRVAQMF